jgi:DNA ligase (NAD+)
MDKKQAAQRIEKLKKLINHYRYLYHVLDKQEISDAALDSLKHELYELEQKFPDLITVDSPTQRVEGRPLDKFKKVRHKISQWSFNDAFSEEEIIEFDARIKRMLGKSLDSRLDYTCELKIDGFKIVLTYEKGILQTAATRGDGKTGEDVTQNAKTIESVPLRLQKDADIVVEGEIWMGKREFARLNQERKKKGEALFANPRNVAAGSIRQLDPKVASSRNLDSFMYDLSGADFELPSTQFEELELLKKLGFKVNKHFKLCKGIKGVVDFWKHWQKKRGEMEYWLDGIVVKLNKTDFQKKLGYTGKSPRFAIALKFPAEQATTVVEDIQVQVGRTGALTPVAHLKPVRVAGSVVSRATLHNEDEIRKLDVRIGDTVIIQKAGDVIPDIIKVIKELRAGKERKFKMPNKCPVCLGALHYEKDSPIIKCMNRQCADRHRRSLHYFTSKKAFGIEGLGPKIIDALLDNGLIRDAADIFELKEGDLVLLEGFAEKSAGNLIESIQNSRKISFSRFIIALGIMHVGEETAQVLADRFGSLKNLKKASIEDMESIQDIGPVVAKSIYKWFRDRHNNKLLERLLKYVTVKEHKTARRRKFTGKKFVLTGSLSSMAREGAKMKIRELGGQTSGSVSKETDYVIVGEDPGSKFNKAKKMGVKILSEEGFLKLLG